MQLGSVRDQDERTIISASERGPNLVPDKFENIHSYEKRDKRYFYFHISYPISVERRKAWSITADQYSFHARWSDTEAITKVYADILRILLGQNRLRDARLIPLRTRIYAVGEDVRTREEVASLKAQHNLRFGKMTRLRIAVIHIYKTIVEKALATDSAGTPDAESTTASFSSPGSAPSAAALPVDDVSLSAAAGAGGSVVSAAESAAFTERPLFATLGSASAAAQPEAVSQDVFGPMASLVGEAILDAYRRGAGVCVFYSATRIRVLTEEIISALSTSLIDDLGVAGIGKALGLSEDELTHFATLLGQQVSAVTDASFDERQTAELPSEGMDFSF